MYTILNNNLQVKGKLTLDNGQGSTAFFGDAITQQIATDNSTDPNNLTTQAFNETDKQGNSKSWGHSLTLSVENTALGSSITTADSILYLDNVSNKYYLMKIIDISGDRNSGFRTINAVNTAVYELGKKLFNTEKTYTKASLADVVNDVYKDVPFSLRIEDDLETVIDYTISAGTSAQAIFQDLQTKYDVDIDSWVELDNSGNLSERVLYFGHLGTDNGELIRYGGTKGFENITAQEVSDTIYTKLWVNGQTDDKNPNNGHIGSVNNGLEYIIDDVANAREYPIGANQQQPAYLEGIITNNLLSEPQALLDWAKLQMPIFNHARFNYTVTPLHDQVVGIGDTVAVQDFHMQPMILVTSKVIQKVTSFASPETNTFVLGEFSNIFTKQLNKNSNVITLIKKDVTVVQEAADNARVAADEAHKQAVIAQSKAIKAQTSADGKTMSFTVASVGDLPVKANEGDIAWVTLEDGTHGYTFINGHWIEDINPNLKKSIQDGVTTAVTQAKEHVEEVKQGLSSDIATAKSQAASQISSAITDNNGKIISLINQDSSGVQIAGKNIVLDGNTTVTGTFKVSQANIANGAIGTAQIGDAVITSAKIANLDASKISGGTISGVDFLVNKSITIASGGNIQSDVVNMGKTSFNVNATNIATERYSTQGYLVRGNGSFLIDSQLGNIGSWGTISVAMPGKTDNYKNGYFHSEYGINNMLLQAYNYDNGEDDETMNLSSSALDYYTMKKNTKELTRSTNIKSGSVFVSDSVTSNGTVSSKHIMLNDTHGIVMLDNVDLYLLGANGNPVGMHGKSWSNTSLRSMKENFSNVEPEYALDEVLKTDIKSYNFKGDEITDNYVSPIIDDTEGEFYIPKDFLDSTGRGVKTYSIDGYLIQAIKALQEQITELKQG